MNGYFSMSGVVWLVSLLFQWVGFFAVLLAAWVFIGPRIQDRIIAWRARRIAP
jgi:hypothetical protein